MPMSKKTKHMIYAAILVVALGVLAIDQLLLSGGEESGTTSSAALDTPHKSPSAVAAGTPRIPVPSPDMLNQLLMSDRLQRYAEANGLNLDAVADAFKTPASWVVATAPTPSVGRPSANPTLPPAPSELSGIMISGRTRVALIDGQVVAVGTEINGYRLIAVSDKSATLAYGEHQVTLELDQPGSPAPKVQNALLQNEREEGED